MYLIDNDGDRWDALGNEGAWRLSTAEHRVPYLLGVIRLCRGPLKFYYDDGTEAPDPEAPDRASDDEVWQEVQFLPDERVRTMAGRLATVVSGPYKTSAAEEDDSLSWLVQTDDGLYGLHCRLTPEDYRLPVVARVLRESDVAATDVELAAQLLRALDELDS